MTAKRNGKDSGDSQTEEENLPSVQGEVLNVTIYKTGGLLVEYLKDGKTKGTTTKLAHWRPTRLVWTLVKCKVWILA